MNIILYAIPVFIALIAIEWVVDKARGTSYYRLNDSLTSLATGLINRMVDVLLLLIPFTLYVYVEEQFALFEFVASGWIWVLAFIVYDFLYYWNHRMGHEVNLLWAAHVVHHSSEEYNLTTALRQTGTGFLSVLFYFPMAILGVDPVMLLTVGSLNLVYQFWVHTRHIGKLGYVERFFVSPSNHRVHHAQNAIYIDKNYGGVFIIWDRLFGTYQEELDSEPVIFGITDAVKSWNPLWVNAQVYLQLARDAYHSRTGWNRFSIWFRRTGWRPLDVEARFPSEKVDLDLFEKFDTSVPAALKIYSVMQYIQVATVAVYFFINAPEMLTTERLYSVIYVLVGVYGIGAIMEGQHYAGVIEWLRNALVSVVVLNYPATLFYALILLTVASLPFLFTGRFQQDQAESISIESNTPSSASDYEEGQRTQDTEIER